MERGWLNLIWEKVDREVLTVYEQKTIDEIYVYTLKQ